MLLLVNGLLTLVFVLLFVLSAWFTRRLLGDGTGPPDTPGYIDDDDLANAA